MPLILAAALAVAPTLPNCSWDRPGHNPFMGDVVAAVDRYPDIPAATRAKLKVRMAARRYDEIATIRRDSIEGRARYAPEIRDMHFGQGQVCGTVTRARWTPQMQERGLVYCEDGHCILVPTVCRNVSRIERLAPAAVAPSPPGQTPAGAGQAAGGGGEDPAAAMAAALDLAPPGAGMNPPTGADAAAPGSFGALAGLAVLPGGDSPGADAAGPALPDSVLSPDGGQAGPGGGGSGGWGAPDSPWMGGTGGGWSVAEPGRGSPAPGAGGGETTTSVDGPVDVGRLGPSDPRELVPTAPTLPVPGDLLVAQAVPEPGSAALLAAGLAGLLAWTRRRQRQAQG